MMKDFHFGSFEIEHRARSHGGSAEAHIAHWRSSRDRLSAVAGRTAMLTFILFLATGVIVVACPRAARTIKPWIRFNSEGTYLTSPKGGVTPPMGVWFGAQMRI